MLKRRGKIVRGLFVLSSAVPSIVDLARGMWRADSRSRWLVPLAVFLCTTGLLLVLAATVEFVAPFVYTIF
jgi:uncharacterized protein DUF5989